MKNLISLVCILLLGLGLFACSESASPSTGSDIDLESGSIEAPSYDTPTGQSAEFVVLGFDKVEDGYKVRMVALRYNQDATSSYGYAHEMIVPSDVKTVHAIMGPISFDPWLIVDKVVRVYYEDVIFDPIGSKMDPGVIEGVSLIEIQAE